MNATLVFPEALRALRDTERAGSFWLARSASFEGEEGVQGVMGQATTERAGRGLGL